MKKPRAMGEIYEIRLKMYKEWKNMSRDEIIKSIKDSAKRVRMEIGKISQKD